MSRLQLVPVALLTLCAIGRASETDNWWSMAVETSLAKAGDNRART